MGNTNNSSVAERQQQWYIGIDFGTSNTYIAAYEATSGKLYTNQGLVGDKVDKYTLSIPTSITKARKKNGKGTEEVFYIGEAEEYSHLPKFRYMKQTARQITPDNGLFGAVAAKYPFEQCGLDTKLQFGTDDEPLTATPRELIIEFFRQALCIDKNDNNIHINKDTVQKIVIGCPAVTEVKDGSKIAYDAVLKDLLFESFHSKEGRETVQSIREDLENIKEEIEKVPKTSAIEIKIKTAENAIKNAIHVINKFRKFPEIWGSSENFLHAINWLEKATKAVEMANKKLSYSDPAKAKRYANIARKDINEAIEYIRNAMSWADTIEVVPEPELAGLTFLAQLDEKTKKNTKILVVDIGGGTTDFSVIGGANGTKSIGSCNIAGNDIDRYIFDKLPSNINHSKLECKKCKEKLFGNFNSNDIIVPVESSDLSKPGAMSTYYNSVGIRYARYKDDTSANCRIYLNEKIDKVVDNIFDKIIKDNSECQGIKKVLFTGGTSIITPLREKIIEKLETMPHTDKIEELHLWGDKTLQTGEKDEDKVSITCYSAVAIGALIKAYESANKDIIIPRPTLKLKDSVYSGYVLLTEGSNNSLILRPIGENKVRLITAIYHGTNLDNVKLHGVDEMKVSLKDAGGNQIKNGEEDVQCTFTLTDNNKDTYISVYLKSDKGYCIDQTREE